ncbi:hypothetical protein [Cohnella thailandensis]|uniref:Uncharacterized protein n=1 Tax=Cohnella thailandensis TaxID=557557 RepID=A0A841STD6_9BACL|nr:hypothetical protein [Cohnella thailandensis]MBB6634249.1 hypothetical protein [Cohnella thailandensis]MBP1972253.1 flagellar biosynthesis component FlhA [Cohnella thailandensis]
MVTAVLAAVFVLLAIVLRRVDKLPMTTVIPLWLFIDLIFGLTFNSIIMNLQDISKPKTFDSFFSFLLLQTLYLPLAVILILAIYPAGKPKSLLKGITLVLGSFLLWGGEAVAVRIGIVTYVNWSPWYSLPLWLALLCLSLGFYRFLNSGFLQRGGKHA